MKFITYDDNLAQLTALNDFVVAKNFDKKILKSL